MSVYDLAPALRLEQRIDAAEGEELRGRWEFGRWMLGFVPEGKKKLPDGLLAELEEATARSRAELKNRRQFAEEFDDERLANSLANRLSWHEIVNGVLGSRCEESDEEAGLGIDQLEVWQTPPDLIAELDREFGFDLHVASLDDALRKPWKGVCWMDTGSAGGLEQWVAKAHRASEDKRTTVVCLLPAHVHADWWWEHCLVAEIRFLHGHLHYGPVAVVIFGRRPRVRWWDRRVEPVRARTRAERKVAR